MEKLPLETFVFVGALEGEFNIKSGEGEQSVSLVGKFEIEFVITEGPTRRVVFYHTTNDKVVNALQLELLMPGAADPDEKRKKYLLPPTSVGTETNPGGTTRHVILLGHEILPFIRPLLPGIGSIIARTGGLPRLHIQFMSTDAPGCFVLAIYNSTFFVLDGQKLVAIAMGTAVSEENVLDGALTLELDTEDGYSVPMVVVPMYRQWETRRFAVASTTSDAELPGFAPRPMSMVDDVSKTSPGGACHRGEDKEEEDDDDKDEGTSRGKARRTAPRVAKVDTLDHNMRWYTSLTELNTAKEVARFCELDTEFMSRSEDLLAVGPVPEVSPYGGTAFGSKDAWFTPWTKAGTAPLTVAKLEVAPAIPAGNMLLQRSIIAVRKVAPSTVVTPVSGGGVLFVVWFANSCAPLLVDTQSKAVVALMQQKVWTADPTAMTITGGRSDLRIAIASFCSYLSMRQVGVFDVNVDACAASSTPRLILTSPFRGVRRPETPGEPTPGHPSLGFCRVVLRSSSTEEVMVARPGTGVSRSVRITGMMFTNDQKMVIGVAECGYLGPVFPGMFPPSESRSVLGVDALAAKPRFGITGRVISDDLGQLVAGLGNITVEDVSANAILVDARIDTTGKMWLIGTNGNIEVVGESGGYIQSGPVINIPGMMHQFISVFDGVAHLTFMDKGVPEQIHVVRLVV